MIKNVPGIQALQLLVIPVLFLISQKIKAQNLPGIQVASLRAPLDIKIDGKLDEWSGKLQANNHTNRMFYTLSNDDDKLYLTIMMTDGLAIDKLLRGGLQFTISHTITHKRTNDPDNAIIRYPFVDKKTGDALTGTLHVFFSYKGNEIKGNERYLDSLVILENKRVSSLLKEIKVAGLNGISDTTISIYNTEGLSTALRFGEKMTCIYELAVPLKCLNLSVNNTVPFSYNIKLLGASSQKINQNAPPAPVPANGEIDHDHEFNVDPTDFWGDYILTKRP